MPNVLRWLRFAGTPRWGLAQDRLVPQSPLLSTIFTKARSTRLVGAPGSVGCWRVSVRVFPVRRSRLRKVAERLREGSIRTTRLEPSLPADTTQPTMPDLRLTRIHTCSECRDKGGVTMSQATCGVAGTRGHLLRRIRIKRCRSTLAEAITFEITSRVVLWLSSIPRPDSFTRLRKNGLRGLRSDSKIGPGWASRVEVRTSFPGGRI